MYVKHTIPVFDQLPLLFGQLRENGKNGFSYPNKNNSKTLQPYVAFLGLEKYDVKVMYVDIDHTCVIFSNKKDSNKYRCHLCTNTYKKKTYLKRHIKTHTHEKPYKCDICNWAFNQVSGFYAIWFWLPFSSFS